MAKSIDTQVKYSFHHMGFPKGRVTLHYKPTLAVQLYIINCGIQCSCNVLYINGTMKLERKLDF